MELKQYGSDWIITGGFPCQDISIAGKGAGIHGSRSSLWFEYWRIIRDLRPRIAIMENVGQLVRRGLREVLGCLAEIGYDAQWQDIRAIDMGAPHKRERIWIVAYPNPAGNRQSRNREETAIKKGLQEGPEYARKLESGLKRLCEDVANTGLQPAWVSGIRFNNKQKQCETEKFRSSEGDRFADSGENVSYYDTERCKEQHYRITERPGDFNFGNVGRKAEHAGWAIEPAVGILVNGLPGRVDRLKGLGNSIVHQIAELIFLQIKDKIY